MDESPSVKRVEDIARDRDGLADAESLAVIEQACQMNRCVMAWAWDQRVTPTQKLVFLALAEHASEAYDCWPGEERLMELTGLPLQAVNKAVCDLEAMGLILCLRLKLIKVKR